ncbi:MAG TPA: carbohydrate kinase [Firmicutes bacterium]|nr:carbohydrate kinase [Bacillota bacterium]
MKKVYCIGELLIDLVSTNGDSYLKKPGGAPANVGVAVSKLGGDAYFLGQVGQDKFGNFLKKVLDENGVNTTFTKVDGKTTLALVSIDPSGERSFEFYRGSDEAYEVAVADLLVDTDTIVHFGSATAFLGGKLMETYYNVLAQAKSCKAVISFDPNYRDVLISKAQLEDYIQHCQHFMKEADFIKLSDEEAMLLTKTTCFDEAVAALKALELKTIAITLGKEGTMLMQNGETTIVKSIAIEQKDSTGAGDAFVGGVLFGLANDEIKPMNQIIEFANVVGAMTCEQYGAIPAIPTMEQVVARLSK